MGFVGCLTFASFLAVASLSIGCSSIRVVQKTPQGGTLAFRDLQDGAREKADDYMRGQCPRGYDVLEEGEARATADTTEWHITYHCNGSVQEAKAREVVIRF